MKYLLIIVVLAVGGYFAYQEFFNNDMSDEITDVLMKDIDGVPRSTVKTCVAIELSGMSDSEQKTIQSMLANQDQSTHNYSSMDNAMADLEKSLNFFNPVMQCVMTKMMGG